jgi:4-hydroxy-tetrahydrodipicolinate synthase
VKVEIEGIIPPHVTPFRRDAEVDEAALRRLVHFWLENGSSGLMSCGSNGEAPYMSREERRRVVEVVVDEVNEEAPVIAGTGAPSTRESILLTQDAEDVGVDAAIVVTPYYFKPDRRELVEHYRALLNAVEIPVILYNVPKFTGYNLDPSVVVELADEYSQIIALKDSSGSIGQITDLIRLVGDKVNILAGTGDLILPTLLMGGRGGIVGIANVVPRLCASIFTHYKKGQFEEAREAQMKILQLNAVLFKKYNQVSSVKEAMNQLGLPAGHPRRPSLPLTRKAREDVKESLRILRS